MCSGLPVASFGEGSMGFSFKGDIEGDSIAGTAFVITNVVSGGVAAAAGVCVGDTLLKVNAQSLTSYAATMQALKGAARPVEITFGKNTKNNIKT